MTTTINKATPVSDVVRTVQEATEQLRQAGTVSTVEYDFAGAIVKRLFTDKPSAKYPAGRSTRLRTSPGLLSDAEVDLYLFECPEGTSAFQVASAARYTKRILDWHLSTGHLLSLHAVRWDAWKLFDPLDTLAQTILVLSGARFRALSAWADTGLIGVGR